MNLAVLWWLDAAPQLPPPATDQPERQGISNLPPVFSEPHFAAPTGPVGEANWRQAETP